MKRLITTLTSGLFLASLIVPAASLAGEEIQLAAAIGNAGANRAVEQPVRNETITMDTTIGETGMLVGQAVAIGVGIAGVAMAAKKVESTSNH